jgi:hypothetical protein
MSPITTLAAVALVLADTLLGSETGVTTTTTRSLAIAALLALAAALASWLRRQVWFVVLPWRRSR